jgi:hypothetical protein
MTELEWINSDWYINALIALAKWESGERLLATN